MAFHKVAITVPVYINHPSLYPVVERFFNSLKEYYWDIVLIAIDDNSPLPHDFPVSVRHEENEGFTSTANECLEWGFGLADTVIVANDDLIIHEGDLDRFFDLDPTKPIIAAPMDTSASNDDRFGAIWGITRAAWNLLGPLNASYKHFYSDLDYLHRAKAKNVEIIKWHDIVIEHAESATYKNEDKQAMLETDLAEYERNHHA